MARSPKRNRSRKHRSPKKNSKKVAHKITKSEVPKKLHFDNEDHSEIAADETLEIPEVEFDAEEPEELETVEQDAGNLAATRMQLIFFYGSLSPEVIAKAKELSALPAAELVFGRVRAVLQMPVEALKMVWQDEAWVREYLSGEAMAAVERERAELEAIAAAAAAEAAAKAAAAEKAAAEAAAIAAAEATAKAEAEAIAQAEAEAAAQVAAAQAAAEAAAAEAAAEAARAVDEPITEEPIVDSVEIPDAMDVDVEQAYSIPIAADSKLGIDAVDKENVANMMAQIDQKQANVFQPIEMQHNVHASEIA
jgi:uncharacterized membrane protein YqiK